VTVLELTVPSDAVYRDTVRALAVRVAEFVGYAPADAVRLAGAVDEALGSVLEHGFPQERQQPIGVTFASGDGWFEMRVSYRAPLGRAQAVERGLGPADARVHALRRAVDRVEFGRERDLDFCRLVRRLPQEPSGR
jgi:anti-sigma regulatory factor (Ser/Thr protein kinase)